MKKYLALGLAVLALAIFVGCSSESGKDTAQTEKPAVQTTSPAAKDETAKEATLAFSNPKEGVDPVCGMSADGTTMVTIADKHYAVCSTHCGEQLKANPDKYLVATADESHEGHQH
jgi:YHS domain-containing protein